MYVCMYVCIYTHTPFALGGLRLSTDVVRDSVIRAYIYVYVYVCVCIYIYVCINVYSDFYGTDF